MPNPAKIGSVRTDQSKYPNYRTPSRPAERRAWEAIRLQIFKAWEKGWSSRVIAGKLVRIHHANQHGKIGVTATTVRGYYQRIYNEFGLTGNNRSPTAALYLAYRLNLLPCPCSHQHGVGVIREGADVITETPADWSPNALEHAHPIITQQEGVPPSERSTQRPPDVSENGVNRPDDASNGRLKVSAVKTD